MANTSRLPKKRDKSLPLGRYLESIGGSLTVAGFFTTFPAKLYWVGVGLFFGGMLFVALGVLWEDWKLGWRLLVCLFWSALTVLVAVAVVFVPAPLSIAANSGWGAYADKSDVYGISWERGMSELRVTLLNQTDNNYDDLDFNMVPDVETRKVVQVTSVPNVTLMVGGDTGASGEIISDSHLLVNGVEQPQPTYSSRDGFRLLCSRFPKHSKMELIVALVNPVQIPGSSSPNKVTSVLRSGDPEDFAGPKKVATKMSIRGDYFVMNHPHKIDIREYAISPPTSAPSSSPPATSDNGNTNGAQVTTRPTLPHKHHDNATPPAVSVSDSSCADKATVVMVNSDSNIFEGYCNLQVDSTHSLNNRFSVNHINPASPESIDAFRGLLEAHIDSKDKLETDFRYKRNELRDEWRGLPASQREFWLNEFDSIKDRVLAAVTADDRKKLIDKIVPVDMGPKQP